MTPKEYADRLRADADVIERLGVVPYGDRYFIIESGDFLRSFAERTVTWLRRGSNIHYEATDSGATFRAVQMCGSDGPETITLPPVEATPCP